MTDPLNEATAVRALANAIGSIRLVMRCLENIGEPEKHELLYQECHKSLGIYEASIQKIVRKLAMKPSWRREILELGKSHK